MITPDDIKPNPKPRGRPRIPLLERVLRHVTIDPETKCWHWNGALSITGGMKATYAPRYYRSKRDGALLTSEKPRALMPVPIMKIDGVSGPFLRKLKDVPAHQRLRRRVGLCTDRLCVNPEHWTYPGEEMPDPEDVSEDFALAVRRWESGGYTMSQLDDYHEQDTIDRLKERFPDWEDRLPE